MNEEQRKAIFAKLPSKYKVGKKLLSEEQFKKYKSEKRCNIVRMYKDPNKNEKIIKRDVSLSVAKLHCSDPKTKTDKYMDGFRVRK